MSGAIPGSLIPPEVSYDKTDSKLFELDEDGNEVRELPRLSKRNTKHVSFPAEEEQRDSLLVPLPSPEGKEEQICLGLMETDFGSESKPNEETVYEKTIETPSGYKVISRKIVRRLNSKRGSSRQKDDKFSKKELLLILCVILFVLVVIIAVAAVIIVMVIQQQNSEVKIKQGKDKPVNFLSSLMYFSFSHNEI